jgi:hypothetical protein
MEGNDRTGSSRKRWIVSHTYGGFVRYCPQPKLKIMVTFNKENRTFSVVFEGTEEDYLNVLRSVLYCVANIEEQTIDKESIYYLMNLVKDMLPDHDQRISITEYEKPG